MNRWVFMLGLLLAGGLVPASEPPEAPVSSGKKVYILPIKEDIMPPLVYLVRRGVKEAMEAKADLLVIDMDTNGGQVNTTEEIMEIIGQFKGQTVTYVNKHAFSAGAFISVATQKIYMAPQSVIGAAAPIMLLPGGTGIQEMPATYEAKMNSAIAAIVRTSAEKNGHNKEVVQAMVDKTAELIIDGKTINKKGNILTLTNKEAEEKYGTPPKPLLSLGTVESIDELLKLLGYQGSERKYVKSSGAEKLAVWINAIRPLLLIIGIVCIYIEMKTPGFGLPGTIGIAAFVVYFLGGYVAGLAGMEWLALFFLGLALVVLELFVFPGTVLLGVGGALLMFLSIVMGMVDVFPGVPVWPTLPQQLGENVLPNLLITFAGTAAAVWILSQWLPKTSLYARMVTPSASGMESVVELQTKQSSRVGQVGVTTSPLRPGGKAQFGEEIIDVVSQGEMIPAGQKVQVIGHSSYAAIVEPVKPV
ncbi:MAG: NfeD family protein [Verrucomicrobiota bacterium]